MRLDVKKLIKKRKINSHRGHVGDVIRVLIKHTSFFIILVKLSHLSHNYHYSAADYHIFHSVQSPGSAIDNFVSLVYATGHTVTQKCRWDLFTIQCVVAGWTRA